MSVLTSELSCVLKGVLLSSANIISGDKAIPAPPPSKRGYRLVKGGLCNYFLYIAIPMYLPTLA